MERSQRNSPPSNVPLYAERLAQLEADLSVNAMLASRTALGEGEGVASDNTAWVCVGSGVAGGRV